MKSDEEFLKDYETSVDVVGQVVEWLKTKGYNCREIPSDIRPDSSVRMEYMDDGDIEVIQRCEVKYRQIDFDSVEAFPFPTVFIDEEYKLLRHHPATLYGYVIVNKSRTGMLLIPRSTRKLWIRDTRWDKTQKRDCTTMCAPKNCSTYFSL